MTGMINSFPFVTTGRISVHRISSRPSRLTGLFFTDKAGGTGRRPLFRKVLLYCIVLIM